ncbi:MAG: hypothetical protein AAB403_21475, partial [Planctomycetota bacterium]
SSIQDIEELRISPSRKSPLDTEMVRDLSRMPHLRKLVITRADDESMVVQWTALKKLTNLCEIALWSYCFPTNVVNELKMVDDLRSVQQMTWFSSRGIISSNDFKSMSEVRWAQGLRVELNAETAPEILGMAMDLAKTHSSKNRSFTVTKVAIERGVPVQPIAEPE